jgi:GTP-binding protein
MPLFQKAVFLTTVANLRDFLRIRCVKSLLPVVPTPEIFCHQHAGRPCPPGFCQQDPRPHAASELFHAGGWKVFRRLAWLWFAKAPEAIRSQWEGLIGPYLSKREPLAGLVVIMDSGGHDRFRFRLIDWFRPTGRPIHILLSKADKLSRQEQTKACVRSSRSRDLGRCRTVFGPAFSSLKKTGVEEAERVLAGWLEIEMKTRKTKGPRIRGSGGKMP